MRQIRQGVVLEQQQKLFMTTELRQAISILQMSAIELNDYIWKEVEENPFLEEDLTKQREKGDDVNRQISIDEVASYFTPHSYEKSERAERPESNSFENYVTHKPSLYEYLKAQFDLDVKRRADLVIGDYLLGSLDSNGYLCTDVNEVGRKLQVRVSHVERVLQMIQDLYPPGVGARNLRECLLLQLNRRAEKDGLAIKIVQNYLQDLAAKKLQKIARMLSVPVQEVQAADDLIKKLNPKPGAQYGNEADLFVWPDVKVLNEQSCYTVIVNDLNFPCLKMNQDYLDLIRCASPYAEEVKHYLHEKMEAALGLIRGIEQRRMNIYKVTNCIVGLQREFLDRGIEYLKPLTMGQIADLVNIHESTVSRVASNKYVQTPRGLFELKFFFNSGVESSTLAKVCSKSVKHLIQEIIREEDPTQPLSDQAITELLVNKGINISRRTVNKYRQSMNIPPNNYRKRY